MHAYKIEIWFVLFLMVFLFGNKKEKSCYHQVSSGSSKIVIEASKPNEISEVDLIIDKDTSYHYWIKFNGKIKIL